MVVILLLTPPYTSNGCDGGSNGSSTQSTTSTGDTAIPAATYHSYAAQLSRHNPASTAPPPTCHTQPNAYCGRYVCDCNCDCDCDDQRLSGIEAPYETAAAGVWAAKQNVQPPPLPKSKAPYDASFVWQPVDEQCHKGNAEQAMRPNAIPKPPRASAILWADYRQRQQTPLAQHEALHRRNHYTCNCTDDGLAQQGPGPQYPNQYEPQQQSDQRWNQQQQQQQHQQHKQKKMPRQAQGQGQRPRPRQSAHSRYPYGDHPHAPHSTSSPPTNTTDIVRHVTRVNFYDIDTSQVDFEPKDNTDCDTEAITKEEEWITKKKTELTTTRQIETRVKRQVVLEDGKVVEDTGPIVSTNTTEDTDKQETETTEKRNLGIPQNETGMVEGMKDAPEANADVSKEGRQLAEYSDDGNGKIVVVKRLVPRPADGLVQESNEKRVITHEEKKDYLETEDVKHLGDITDEVYVQAVTSGVENLEEVLLAPESQQQLVSSGPRIVANTTKSFKTIDTEDIDKRRLLQDDGKLITESKKITEHEVIIDKELPGAEGDNRSGGSGEKIVTTEASQRFFKQRDEHHVDLIADNKVIGTEMRYAAETMQIEKEGSLERPGDWDSLSDRMRKLRRQPKTLMQQHKEAALLADRKDALTKRPLDFDREEETRKGETMKWLESHFGSESTASNDSRDDDTEIEPTKKTFFNVTIKSGQAHVPAVAAHTNRPVNIYDRKGADEQASMPISNGAPRSKYYHGISNWTERKEEPSGNHFSSKAFRDDLQETVERNRLKKGGIYGAREQTNKSRYSGQQSSDDYVSREDILQQKRQSLSSQFLARTKRASHDKLNELSPLDLRDEGRKVHHHSRTDLRYGADLLDASTSHHSSLNSQITPPKSQPPASRIDRPNEFKEGMDNGTYRYNVSGTNMRKSYTRSPSPERHLPPISTSTLGRPTVPQRRRAIERKLQQQNSVISASKTTVPLRYSESRQSLVEPPPDYSPPPRSRSSSPHGDFITQPWKKEPRINNMSYNHTSKVSGTHADNTSTLTKKQHQRTRFAPTTPTLNGHHHNGNIPQATKSTTTQTTPSNISTSTVASHKSNRVGQVIGNSLRKLVNKIRSASAERKLRMKSKSKSREHSPSPQVIDKSGQHPESTTYQQYNVIDGHIGAQPHSASNESEQESLRHEAIVISSKREPITAMKSNEYRSSERNVDNFRRANSADPFTVNPSDSDQTMTPRQRYYLGEDPYSSTLYGKEHMHDSKGTSTTHNRNGRHAADNQHYGPRQVRDVSNSSHYNGQRNISSSTLGRYQKTNRYAGSTPNLSQEYRSVQTLPRKLNDKHKYPEHSQQQQQQHQQQHQQQPQPLYQKASQRIQTNGQTSNIGSTGGVYTDRRQQYQPITHNMGPAKPMRTYAKALNRSKSFNVHGMNGSSDPSPIYIEKLTKNNYNNSNLHYSHAYKSNPHLNSGLHENSMGLKSPSIVNLVSRSQKDLSRIGLPSENYEQYYTEQLDKPPIRPALKKDDKKQVFLKGLHQQAPELFRTLHGEEEYNMRTHTRQHLKAKHSFDSRPPVELNKDTASIIRRDDESNYPSLNVGKSGERKWTSGATVIEVRK